MCASLLLPIKIEIPPFRTSLHKITKPVSYEVKFALQCSHLELLLLSKFWSEKGILIFWIMIPKAISLHAVVVLVLIFQFYSDYLWPCCATVICACLLNHPFLLMTIVMNVLGSQRSKRKGLLCYI